MKSYLLINLFLSIFLLIPISGFTYGPSCSGTKLTCDASAFQNVFSSLVMARVLEQKDKYKISVPGDLQISKSYGKASCYANTEFCQSARVDGYAYKKTASGVCAEPDKYTAAIDVKSGDPIYGSRRLGSLVFANNPNNGQTAVFVVTDRGNMNKYGVKFDLVESVQNKLRNDRDENVEFYGLRRQYDKLSQYEMEDIVNCVTLYNNSFDSSLSHLSQLSSDQKLQIEVAAAQKLKDLGVSNGLSDYKITMNELPEYNLSRSQKFNSDSKTEELVQKYQEIDEKIEKLFAMNERKSRSMSTHRAPASKASRPSKAGNARHAK